MSQTNSNTFSISSETSLSKADKNFNNLFFLIKVFISGALSNQRENIQKIKKIDSNFQKQCKVSINDIFQTYLANFNNSIEDISENVKNDFFNFTSFLLIALKDRKNLTNKISNNFLLILTFNNLIKNSNTSKTKKDLIFHGIFISCILHTIGLRLLLNFALNDEMKKIFNLDYQLNFLNFIFNNKSYIEIKEYLNDVTELIYENYIDIFVYNKPENLQKFECMQALMINQNVKYVIPGLVNESKDSLAENFCIEKLIQILNSEDLKVLQNNINLTVSENQAIYFPKSREDLKSLIQNLKKLIFSNFFNNPSYFFNKNGANLKNDNFNLEIISSFKEQCKNQNLIHKLSAEYQFLNKYLQCNQYDHNKFTKNQEIENDIFYIGLKNFLIKNETIFNFVLNVVYSEYLGNKENLDNYEAFISSSYFNVQKISSIANEEVIKFCLQNIYENDIILLQKEIHYNKKKAIIVLKDFFLCLPYFDLKNQVNPLLFQGEQNRECSKNSLKAADGHYKERALSLKKLDENNAYVINNLKDFIKSNYLETDLSLLYSFDIEFFLLRSKTFLNFVSSFKNHEEMLDFIIKNIEELNDLSQENHPLLFNLYKNLCLNIFEKYKAFLKNINFDMTNLKNELYLYTLMLNEDVLLKNNYDEYKVRNNSIIADQIEQYIFLTKIRKFIKLSSFSDIKYLASVINKLFINFNHSNIEEATNNIDMIELSTNLYQCLIFKKLGEISKSLFSEYIETQKNVTSYFKFYDFATQIVINSSQSNKDDEYQASWTMKLQNDPKKVCSKNFTIQDILDAFNEALPEIQKEARNQFDELCNSYTIIKDNMVNLGDKFNVILTSILSQTDLLQTNGSSDL